MKRISWLLVTVAALMGLGGCHGAPGPTPVGPFEPGPSVSVPPIPVPLNGAKFKADPCTAFSPAQLNNLGFETGKQTKEPDGNSCYITLRPGITVRASRISAIPESLATLYRDRARGFDTRGNHWEEVTVAGYPAVIVDIQVDITSHLPETCRLALGADDSTLITLTVGAGIPEAGPWKDDPCGAAKKLAEVVVDNLRI